MKKILIGILLIFLFLNVQADSITNYTIRESVPLGLNLTIYGEYVADNNSGVLCSFFIKDLNDFQSYVIRLTDRKTFSDGTFYTEYALNEPDFKRTYDYNVITKCGTATAWGITNIQQREEISHTAQQEFEYIFAPKNLDSIFILATVLFFILLIVGIVFFFKRFAKNQGSRFP